MAFRVTYTTLKGTEKELKFNSVSDACLATGIPYHEVYNESRVFMVPLTRAFADILGNRLGASKVESYDILDPDGHMDRVRDDVKKTIKSFRPGTSGTRTCTGYTKYGPFDNTAAINIDNSFMGLTEIYPEIEQIYNSRKESKHLRLEYGERLIIALEIKNTPQEYIDEAIRMLGLSRKWLKSLDGITLQYAETSIIFFINHRLELLLPFSIQSRKLTKYEYTEALTKLDKNNLSYAALTAILSVISGNCDLKKFTIELINNLRRAFIKEDLEKNRRQTFHWTHSTEMTDYSAWIRTYWWRREASYSNIIGLQACLIEATRDDTLEDLQNTRLVDMSSTRRLLGLRELRLDKIDSEAEGSIKRLRITLSNKLSNFKHEKDLMVEYNEQLVKERIKERELKEQRTAEREALRLMRKAYSMREAIIEHGPRIQYWENLDKSAAKDALEELESCDRGYSVEELVYLITTVYKESILAELRQGSNILNAILNRVDTKRKHNIEDLFDPVYATKGFGIDKKELDSRAKSNWARNKNQDPTDVWIQAATEMIIEESLTGVS